jgi:hypothetical protein
MSATSISQAANDPALRARVLAQAHKEMEFDDLKANSTFGKTLNQIGVEPLMYPVAVATEAQYETALMSGRGAPGHDTDIISDGDLTSAINANWPWAEGEGPNQPGNGGGA